MPKPRNYQPEATITKIIKRRVKERRSLSYITNSPSPYQGEGDKGDRVNTICLKLPTPILTK